LTLGKGNHAGLVPTLEFRIEVHDFPIDGRPFREVRAVDWIETEITIEGAMNASTGAPGRPRHEDKRDAVLAVLSDEPQGQRAIAEASGVPRSTVQRILDQLEYDGAIRVERGWVGQEGVAPNSTKKKWATHSLPVQNQDLALQSQPSGPRNGPDEVAQSSSLDFGATPDDERDDGHHDDRQGLLDDLRELGL
jgi:Sugar-specific transcriptional regulator TrmB